MLRTLTSSFYPANRRVDPLAKHLPSSIANPSPYFYSAIKKADTLCFINSMIILTKFSLPATENPFCRVALATAEYGDYRRIDKILTVGLIDNYKPGQVYIAVHSQRMIGPDNFGLCRPCPKWIASCTVSQSGIEQGSTETVTLQTSPISPRDTRSNKVQFSSATSDLNLDKSASQKVILEQREKVSGWCEATGKYITRL